MRPFVLINIASSLDGKISNENREQIKISSQEDFEVVDRLRAESDAIMVGIGTVLSDDPRLTVKNDLLKRKRLRKGKSVNPLRVVVDSKCRIPLNSKILNDEADTLIAVTEKADKKRVEEVKKRAEVFVAGNEKVDLKMLLNYLYKKKGIEKLMVEGGGELNYSLIKEELVDEIRIFYSGMIIGGKNSPTPVDGFSFSIPLRAKLKSFEVLGNGIAVVWSLR